MKTRFRRLLAASLLLAAPSLAASSLPAQPARWTQQAQRVTIMRDQWGIAHVYGKTDADAVFGMVYAQAEDDFNRVETNYINAMGRLAEVEGEKEIWRDLRMKMFIDTLDMKKQYAASPAWLKALMNGFADGLNYYLHTHPEVKPRLITRFQPWMALSFSEGSIGGDIESVNLRGIEQFYGARGGAGAGGDVEAGADAALSPFGQEPGGSNGFAIAPGNTTNGHALLMINPHTSFYFRPEIHMASEEGLDAYGAVTWGQFFIYQGFNSRLGWMHTSGGGDVIDEYLETVTPKGSGFTYRHGGVEKPVRVRTIVLPYKTASGMQRRTVTAYFTHHGPVIRSQDGKWVAVAMMQEPLKALQQSYLRTKAKDYASFRKIMELRTNSSNNTVYADADGVISYFHGNFIPKRNAGIDFSKPVDGSDAKNDWQGLHALNEMITVHNPKSGWLMNTNNWPFTASGADSPKIGDWPVYMSEQRDDNPRGVHAVRVLQNRKDFTLDGLIGAAYDSYLPAFEQLMPPLLAAYDALPAGDSLKTKLAEQVAQLRSWDYRFAANSVPMALANAYGEEVSQAAAAPARASGTLTLEFVKTKAPASLVLGALSRASDRLTRDFGTWKTPWGEINRYQRLSGDIGAAFDDNKPSIAVPFASANWGSLAAFGQTGARTTKRMYGNRGNSFVAAVEFGPKVRAKSVLAGGVNSSPSSPYFFNQAERYAAGNFKDVNYYRADVEKNATRTYKPGK
ncbi:MAG TPA: acylase [Gemmatimonas aurantiaca]|uniref:Acylase n=2 Tax=Gemmatimonas aurantiaca TaxID=173480 RepID=A0A3D4V9L4_9BACT|nr:penicillin acylase family protein [Gemmatimonas aurantiaca]BAH40189.1 putative penicillin amidase [Gemmatimonas aurantiaca T-27]HCT57801.1 acylase [Gemmatimonas aurantiaca]